MESIAPTLRLCREAIQILERGHSLHEGLRSAHTQLPQEIQKSLAYLYFQYNQTGEISLNDEARSSIYRQELFLVIGAGIKGEPVLSRLRELESEIYNACLREVEAYISILPIYALVPVLLIQFPAFLILILGPLIEQFTRSLTT